MYRPSTWTLFMMDAVSLAMYFTPLDPPGAEGTSLFVSQLFSVAQIVALCFACVLSYWIWLRLTERPTQWVIRRFS